MGKYKKQMFPFFLATLVSGCATEISPALKDKALSILGEKCFSIFSNESWVQYQHVAQHPLNTRPPSFAFVKDSGGSACGWAGPTDAQDEIFSMGTLSKIEAIALARCEAIKPDKVKAPCKIFAIGNKIVWDQKQTINME